MPIFSNNKYYEVTIYVKSRACNHHFVFGIYGMVDSIEYLQRRGNILWKPDRFSKKRNGG